MVTYYMYIFLGNRGFYMKKVIALLCACLLLTATACGGTTGSSSDDVLYKSSDSSSAASKKKSSSSSSAAEKTESTEAASAPVSKEESSAAEPAEPEKDEIDKIVEAGNVEDFNIDGYYAFGYEGFSKVYSNEEIKKCFDNINSLINNANCKIAISYKNMDTGAQVYYDTYDRYEVCSCIKAPYVKSLLVNNVDLSQIIVKNDVWMDDDGTVASSPYGTEYTVKQLIEYALQESDNTAYYLLYKKFGCQWFNNLTSSIGANIYLGWDYLYTFSTVTDMAKCYWDIYNYSLDNEYGKWMTDLMADAKYNYQIGYALGDKYKVSQKYGSEFEDLSFHNCAIVYADSPFVLCIYTTLYPEIEDSFIIFRELAVEFDKLNRLIAQS